MVALTLFCAIATMHICEESWIFLKLAIEIYRTPVHQLEYEIPRKSKSEPKKSSKYQMQKHF